jgi:hypothetical protein
VTEAYRPSSLEWPPTREQWDALNETIEDIYRELRRIAGSSSTHELLSATHSDTTEADEVDGDLITGQAGAWKRLAKGTNGQVLEMVSGAPAWSNDGSGLQDLNAAELTGTAPTAVVEHDLLSAHHVDTVTADPVVGDIVIATAPGAVDALKYWFDGLSFPALSRIIDAQSYWFDGLPGDALLTPTTPKWQRLAKGSAGQNLIATATGVEWGGSGSTGAGDPVGAHAQQSGNVTLTQGTTATISFGATSYDRGGFWASGSPTRLTIPTGQSGLYHVVGQIDVTQTFSSTVMVGIYKNGTLLAEFEVATPATGGRQVSCIADCLGGDYLELKATHGSAAGDATITGGSNATFLQATKLLQSETVGELLPDPQRGALLKGNAAATEYERLVIGASGTVLLSDGSDPSWSTRPTLRDVAETISGVWDFTNGLKERGRSAKIGEWTDVAYNSGDFTASAGTWTVDSGDVLEFKYALVGKTMFVSFVIAGTDLSSAAEKLKIAIPGGFTAANRSDNFGFATDNGGTPEPATVTVLAGGTTIDCGLLDGTNWASTAADNTNIVGEIFFDVQ